MDAGPQGRGALACPEPVPVGFVRDGAGSSSALSVAIRRTADARSPGRSTIVACDLVGLAIGQSKLRTLACELPGVTLDARGCVVVDAETKRDDNPKVYSGRRLRERRQRGRQRGRRRPGRGARHDRAAVAAAPLAVGRRAMADLTIDFAGIKSPNPFWLASAPADQHRRAGHARVRRGLGRRRLEDARQPDRQRDEPLRRDRLRRTEDDGAQQHRAHHRPAARGEPARDPRGEAALPEARRHRVAHDRDARTTGSPHPQGRGHRLRRARAELRLPARHVRAGDGLVASGRSPSCSRRSPAGRRSSPGPPSS